MKKYFFTMAVMAIFAIGFAASDEESSSSTSTQTESVTIKEEPQKPKKPKCRTCGKEFDADKEYQGQLAVLKNDNYCYLDCPQECGTCGKTYTINSGGGKACFGTCGPCYEKYSARRTIERATRGY